MTAEGNLIPEFSRTIAYNHKPYPTTSFSARKGPIRIVQQIRDRLHMHANVRIIRRSKRGGREARSGFYFVPISIPILDLLSLVRSSAREIAHARVALARRPRILNIGFRDPRVIAGRFCTVYRHGAPRGNGSLRGRKFSQRSIFAFAARC